MKKLVFFLVILIRIESLSAQGFQIEQLALDIQKLAQLKNILNDLYKGYEILNTGYETIRSISQGNFNLHKAFLDGLLAVSPQVKNYVHVADIISYQASLVSEYKTTYSRFSRDKHFNPDEILYLGRVYGNLFDESLKNITHLTDILTAGSLRMSDDERLHAIDGIYNSSRDQLMFLRQFNSSATILAVQRSAEAGDVETLQDLYGLK